MRKMNQAEMDQIVNNHFMYEFTEDVGGVVSTLTEDAVHEIVGGPLGPLQGKAAVRRFTREYCKTRKVRPRPGGAAGSHYKLPERWQVETHGRVCRS
jgi:hypothetical protein